MKSHPNRTLVFILLASQALWLSACSPRKTEKSINSDLILISRGEESPTTTRIKRDQLYSLPSFTKKLLFEANGEEKNTKVVYLSDVLKAFQENKELDFWIVNCGDKYQSNYNPEILVTAQPYLVLEVEDQPLIEWLAAIGHPEWGPNIINIENTEGLLDPSHKNPWGLTEIIALGKEQALRGWADHPLDESAQRGLELFLNSCASCHQSGNGLLGGSVSTRPLPMLTVFAVNAEPYFRNILKSPKETNPLAEKMPSYAHWGEQEVADLIHFLKSRN